MPVELVRAENICFGYNAVDVLHDVSFTVRAGDYVGIVGPNGSGKSTLVKGLLGLIPPSHGEVALFETPLAKFRDWHRIGYLPQRLRFFNPNFPATVEELVRLGLLAEKRFPKRLGRGDEEAVERTLDFMGITAIRKKAIGELSGGQQQRALLARAVVGKPELLIMDEPTTALDPGTRDSFYHLLHHLNQHEGTTVLLVTHDTWSIGKYANRFLYLDKRVVFDGTFDDFCRSEEMTGFFGEHAQHIICHRH